MTIFLIIGSGTLHELSEALTTDIPDEEILSAILAYGPPNVKDVNIQTPPVPVTQEEHAHGEKLLQFSKNDNKN